MTDTPSLLEHFSSIISLLNVEEFSDPHLPTGLGKMIKWLKMV